MADHSRNYLSQWTGRSTFAIGIPICGRSESNLRAEAMAVWNSNPSTIVSDNKEVVRDLCTKAIERVDRAIENHRKGVAEDLSVTMLERVRTELVRMNEVL
jgi:hypothetical protein